MIAIDYILLFVAAFAVWRWQVWKHRVKGRQDAFNAIVKELAGEIVRSKWDEYQGKLGKKEDWPEILK